MSTTTERSYRNDSVPHFTPVSFSIAFVKAMRQENQLVNYPSLRTTISIPKFLSARYFRKESLDPSDYLEAAVYNTPFEDQGIARKVADRLLFPEKEKKLQKKKMVDKSSQKVTKTPDSITGLDVVLAELSDVGLADLSEEATDEEMASKLQDEMKAWDYTANLLNSSDLKSQAILGLLRSLANDYAFIEHGISDDISAIEFLEERLKFQSGTWNPFVFPFGKYLGMSDTLLKYAQMPWELATAMGITTHPEFYQYIEDSFNNLSPASIGKILNYLYENSLSLSDEMINLAFFRVKTLGEHLKLLNALETFIKPSDRVMKNSTLDIKQGLTDAETMYETFFSKSPASFNPISDDLYSFWKMSNPKPGLDQTLDSTYDDRKDSWIKDLANAANLEMKGKSSNELAQMASYLKNFSSQRMSSSMNTSKQSLVQKIADQAISQTLNKENFTGIMEELAKHQALPSINVAIKKGKEFGILEERIQEFYNNPMEILKSNIQSNVTYQSRYNPLIPKLQSIMPDEMNSLMNKAMDNDNQIAMRSLAAMNMGSAMNCVRGKRMPNGSDALESLALIVDKSAGGGENLIKQWFIHRFNIPPEIRARLKAMIKEVLIELAKEWANKFMGNTEEGIVPIVQSRPFKPSDDFDNLDIVSTLEMILNNGKRLHSINIDDLMVHEVKKGRTAFCILIDISGSMSGGNLAMCAIAVCMVLMKMNSEEVAIALFESNTHVLKEFSKDFDLEELVDEILELRAMGGTRVDAALTWVKGQMEQNTESEVKILFLLSDFFFFEQKEEIEKHCNSLSEDEIRILATSHGRDNIPLKELMIEKTNGHGMKISNFRDLPAIIAEAINSID